MRKILIFICLFFLVPNVYASSIPEVDEDKKIYDFADLFSEEEEEEIFDFIDDYIDEYDIDMVVVTIDENDVGSSEEYADDFFDYNDFGIGKNRNGILYLIDMDNREIFVSTSGNAIYRYNDDVVDLILDECYSDVSIEEYGSSAISFVRLAERYYDKEEGRSVNWIATILISLAFPSIILYFMLSSYKKIRLATEADSYIKNDLTKYGMDVDNFISTSTNRVRIKDSSTTSRSSGRVSTRIGSSGRTHGGRGRRF